MVSSGNSGQTTTTVVDTKIRTEPFFAPTGPLRADRKLYPVDDQPLVWSLGIHPADKWRIDGQATPADARVAPKGSVFELGLFTPKLTVATKLSDPDPDSDGMFFGFEIDGQKYVTPLNCGGDGFAVPCMRRIGGKPASLTWKQWDLLDSKDSSWRDKLEVFFPSQIVGVMEGYLTGRDPHLGKRLQAMGLVAANSELASILGGPLTPGMGALKFSPDNGIWFGAIVRSPDPRKPSMEFLQAADYLPEVELQNLNVFARARFEDILLSREKLSSMSAGDVFALSSGPIGGAAFMSVALVSKSVSRTGDIRMTLMPAPVRPMNPLQQIHRCDVWLPAGQPTSKGLKSGFNVPLYPVRDFIGEVRKRLGKSDVHEMDIAFAESLLAELIIEAHGGKQAGSGDTKQTGTDRDFQAVAKMPRATAWPVIESSLGPVKTKEDRWFDWAKLSRECQLGTEVTMSFKEPLFSSGEHFAEKPVIATLASTPPFKSGELVTFTFRSKEEGESLQTLKSWSCKYGEGRPPLMFERIAIAPRGQLG
jgi:hypothetical protein